MQARSVVGGGELQVAGEVRLQAPALEPQALAQGDVHHGHHIASVSARIVRTLFLVTTSARPIDHIDIVAHHRRV